MSDYRANPRERFLGQMRERHRMPEAEALERLLARQVESAEAERRIADRALRLAQAVRAAPASPWSAETFLRHHGLSTSEGVALMCLAEALLRIPDAETADALLREKLGSGRWQDAPDDGSLMASAADWALMLTGTLARWADEENDGLGARVRPVVARLGEPVVRGAVKQAMRLLAEQFVLAETIEKATDAAAGRRPWRFSYDMLGEAARTAEDAERYFESYAHAIRVVDSPTRDPRASACASRIARFADCAAPAPVVPTASPCNAARASICTVREARDLP